MLGKLVNKFKQHSLNDDQTLRENAVPTDPVNEYQEDVLPNVLFSFPNNALNDSGTESENEEELEQLETSYLMSIAAAEMQLGPSPPALTSSPPLISDFDTNSWDSTGCESGIVVQEQGEEPSDGSRGSTAEQPSAELSSTPVYVGETGRLDGAVAAGGLTAVASGNISTIATKNGAFRPFRRRVKEQEAEEVAPNDPTPPVSSPGLIGEKRRYDNITPRPDHDSGDNLPGSCPRITTGGSGIPRETLVACRRTPVKLIIYNPDGVRRNLSQPQPISVPARDGTIDAQGESPPFRPIKRGRLNSCVERPSLDFEKMRERMMNSDWNRSQDSDCEQEGDKRKREDELERTTSPDGPRCTRHETVGCQDPECTFRPVSLDDEACSVSSCARKH